MSPDDNREDPWVTVSIPPVFAAGPSRIAELAGWRIKRDPDGTFRVCLDERYRRTAPRLVELLPILNSRAEQQTGWARLPSWDGEEGRLDQATVDQAANAYLETNTPAGFWSSWQLMVIASSDEALRARLLERHRAVVEQQDDASVWLVDASPTFLARTALVRAFFAVDHAPELLARAVSDFEGFSSARGLSTGPLGLDLTGALGIYCCWFAPWVIGSVANRRASSVVAMFGAPWDGIAAHAPAEMLQLFAPQLLAVSPRHSLPRPELDPQDLISGLRWWTERWNEIAFLLLDPARFRTHDGTYDSAAQFATILSVERLVASTLSSLTSISRALFVRRLMFFDALEVLEGLNQGNYDHLCNLVAVRESLDFLRGALPDEVAQLLLPRCQRAVDALAEVPDGFLAERREDGHVQVRNKRGGIELLTDAGASALYLRSVRNATHSFRQTVKDQRSLSLLAGHNGELPDALSDLALLHVLRVMVEPRRLLPRQARLHDSR